MKITRFANFTPFNENIDSVESSSTELTHSEPEIEAQMINPSNSESSASVNMDNQSELQDISKSLGVPIINNSIKYRGKTINYFSESGKFDINGEKFDTMDDVLKYFGK
jgi:hypothetical protein